jgi:hypothetical protein
VGWLDGIWVCLVVLWAAPGTPGRGLAIGNLTGEGWGSVVLDGLDPYACRTLRVPACQCYVDDFIVFGDDRGALLAIHDALAAWLRDERGLARKAPVATRWRGRRRRRGRWWRRLGRCGCLGDDKIVRWMTMLIVGDRGATRREDNQKPRTKAQERGSGERHNTRKPTKPNRDLGG